MKYVEGQRLDRYVASKPPVHERLGLFQRICEAVAFAHDRGVLHRDLKPENVMVGLFGEVLVMDWGVGKIASEQGPSTGRAGPTDDELRHSRDATHRTEHGAVLGTPGYMAPEQASGEVERVDARADIYSLGAVLRFLLSGQVPPEATELPRHEVPRHDLPRPLLAICEKAMAPEPEKRFA